MKYANIIEGCQIFAKYNERGLDGHLGGADHDIIYGLFAEVDYDAEPLGTLDDETIFADTKISREDQTRLIELGWFIHEDEYWAAFA